MHVYLKHGDQQRWVIVQLVEGHAPRIAGLSGQFTKSVTSTLEPAIWFKVMVLDSVSVDCTKQVVCWTTGASNENGNHEQATRSMFGDEDQFCYDYDDDIDELFKLGQYLVETNPLAESDEHLEVAKECNQDYKTNIQEKKLKNLNAYETMKIDMSPKFLNEQRKHLIQEYEQSLFRMLHCYILSRVKLHPEDIARVSAAYRAQLKVISQLEDKVDLHTRLAEHYMKEMRKIRENEILPMLEAMLSEGYGDTEFLDTLQKDLLKAENVIRSEVNAASLKVDELKKQISSGAASKQIKKDLEDARKHRNDIQQNLHLHLIGRELVSSAFRDIHRDGPPRLSPIIRDYLQLYKQMMQEKKQTSDICQKKLLAASVRECLVNTISDLKKGISTTSDEVTAAGQRTTNVITETGANPEWQTLSERLAVIVHNQDHPVGQAFFDFSNEIHRQCAEILRTVERLADTPAVTAPEIGEYHVVGMQDFVVNSDFIDNLRDQIHEHFEKMTEVIMEFFPDRTQLFFHKVRLGYEKCFFNQVGSDLIKLYRLMHGKSMVSLGERLRQLRDFPVCRLGLQMKEEWWLSLFEPRDKCEDSDGFTDDESGCDAEDEWEEDDFKSQNGSDRSKCHLKIDLMREKLHAGTAKVLSRSYSEQNLLTEPHRTATELMRHEAARLAEEIESKALNQINVDRRSIEHIFGRDLPSPSSSIAESYDEQDGQTMSLKRAGSESGLLSHPKISRCCSTPDLRFCKQSRKYKSASKKDTFKQHFGKALDSIREVFSVKSPLNKMQNLTVALRLIAEKVTELRRRNCDDNVDEMSLAVTAEDLLPLIVLMLLKLKPAEISKLFVELMYISDMMAEFLTSGCHSYALTEFQIAFRVLSQTCEELSL